MDLLESGSLIGIQISGCESEIGRHPGVDHVSIPDRDLGSVGFFQELMPCPYHYSRGCPKK
jgi:hypothetical protein